MIDDPLQEALDRGRPAGAPVDPTADRMLARVRAAMFGVASEPTKIGRFTILATIGAGGMGAVYAAHDPVLDRRVAIKLLRSPDARVHERVLREARALARLAHPNIVAVHETGSVDELVYIAMELVDGENLRGWAQGRSWREIAAAFADAARGLAFAHAAGVIHGDVKPDNLVIGRDGRVRVIDFGLARASGAASSSGAAPAAAPSLVGGTPAYMAPELYDGASPSERADQFGFCVGLYEALHGERPRPFASLAAASASAPVPAALQQIVVRGLAGDPAARHPSMTALADAIAAVLADPLAGARDRRPRRHRRRVLAVLAVAAAALGVGAYAWSAGSPSAGAGPETGAGAETAVLPTAQQDALDHLLDQLVAQTEPDSALAGWPPSAQILAAAGPVGATPAAATIAAQIDTARAGFTVDLGRARFAAAKAVWQNGDHDRARRLAAEARAFFAGAGPAAAADVADVDHWLAERP